MHRRNASGTIILMVLLTAPGCARGIRERYFEARNHRIPARDGDRALAFFPELDDRMFGRTTTIVSVDAPVASGAER